MNNFHTLDKKTVLLLEKIKGPIVIFGAGGFIGTNLLQSLLLYRTDVFGVSQNVKHNWRFKAASIPLKNLINCDINDVNQIKNLVNKIKPMTIFNLAAYGAYSKQKEYRKIYQTNFDSTVDLIEILKENGFEAYVHAGSQSEYGINSRGPKEDSELIPNSHYAVSKTANYYTVKYYGKIEKLPLVHLRLYSAYGPWEEPDRLIPILLAKARKEEYPQLVDPNISRDFIYIQDIVSAFIFAASKMNRKIYGEVFNVATGEKTTIKELVLKVKKILDVKRDPVFGSMQKRDWDLKDWYGNTKKIEKFLKWKPRYSLEEGLKLSIEWQKNMNYDSAFWNWMK